MFAISDHGSAAAPQQDSVRKHQAAVQKRMEMAARPIRIRIKTRSHKQMTRAEMFASPAGIMSALMSLPSVTEIDERGFKLR